MSAERLDTRASILEAAERIIRDRGMASATTREIAREARCAEGSIYRYFDDKHALMTEIIGTRYTDWFEFVEGLPHRAGTGAVGRILEELAKRSLHFYRGIVPMACGAVADRELLHHPQELLAQTKQTRRTLQILGPQLAEIGLHVVDDARHHRLNPRNIAGALEFERLWMAACAPARYATPCGSCSG